MMKNYNRVFGVFFMTLILFVSGCVVEPIQPEDGDDETNQEPEVIIQKEEFQNRTVMASYINIEITRLNVRSTPDEDGNNIVSRVYENDKFQIVEQAYDSQNRLWYQIEYEPGLFGYVAGWFCAETEISIYITEDTTTVTDIKVYPIPTYLDNPFGEDDAEVGDQVVKLVIKEISELESSNKIGFTGEVELTGAYYHETTDEGERVRFVPDEASSPLLPRIVEDISSVWFVLNDYESIKGQFGRLGDQGTATIVIKDYSIFYGNSNSTNKATLVTVEIN
jgi:hypothetical protein